MSKTSTLLDRFRGSMIGAVIGDCLGSPVECMFWHGIPISSALKHFQKYQEFPEKIYNYTDDTAMARQVAESIITMRSIDPNDMSQRFVKEYYNEPERGYGANVCDVFKKLKKTDCIEPFKPASEQFNGSGSYGNGAAMRVHPVGLFCYNNSDQFIIENVQKSAKITHSHSDAINGAIIQAACVMWALQGTKPEDLCKKAYHLSTKFDKPADKDDLTYTEKMSLVDNYVTKEIFDYEKLIGKLGNDVSAINSVPAAIFSFLASCQTNYIPPGCESTENPFERSLQLAMSFGGLFDCLSNIHVNIQ